MNFITKIIETAHHAGFCYGVERAVESAKNIKLENPDRQVFVLGELIHNSYVIKQLEILGIKTVQELEDPAPAGAICIIRSHGASIYLTKKIEAMGYEVVDLTCPDVKKVQNAAIELVREKYFLLILGHPEHPEVVAIYQNATLYAGNFNKVLVIKDMKQLKKNEKLYANKKIGIVIQTTQKIDFLKKAVGYLIDKTPELKVVNTICRSTCLRQNEAIEMAEHSDLMIVAGSKKSANTTHLAQILSDIATTIHIEDETQLDNYADVIEKAEKIGITAGASTPQFIIKKIENKLRKGKIKCKQNK